MKSKFKKAKLKTFKRFSCNQTKKSFSKESSQRLTPMIDKQATKHFCELTPFKWWKLNKNKMCSKSLLTIKSSNESPKYQKTSFKKNGNKQISRKEGENGHKNDFVKQTKVSSKQKWTQRLNQIFLLYRNKAFKILKQKSCVSKINDTCNQRKQD